MEVLAKAIRNFLHGDIEVTGETNKPVFGKISNLKNPERCSTVSELKSKKNNARVPPAGSVLQTQLGSNACMDESF